jgi:hypothetical protein
VPTTDVDNSVQNGIMTPEEDFEIEDTIPKSQHTVHSIQTESDHWMAELGDHSEMPTHNSGLIRNETIRRRGWKVMVLDHVLMGDAFFSHAVEP